MTKWADYLISAVRFEETPTTKHISHVKVHEDKGENLSNPPEIWSKESVIKALDNGKTFKTIVLEMDAWKQGEKVFKVWIVNAYYIKTRADGTVKDNLDNLPTF